MPFLSPRVRFLGIVARIAKIISHTAYCGFAFRCDSYERRFGCSQILKTFSDERLKIVCCLSDVSGIHVGSALTSSLMITSLYCGAGVQGRASIKDSAPHAIQRTL